MIDVGGTVAGNPIGEVVGSTPVSVTIPPLMPVHGQVSAHVVYRLLPAGARDATNTSAPTGIASTQVLYEVYPPPDTPGAQPTDPLPAYFTNIGDPAGISLGPGSISGADAGNFSLVKLSYGVPPGTTDCGFAAATLQQFDQSTSNPLPSRSR